MFIPFESDGGERAASMNTPNPIERHAPYEGTVYRPPTEAFSLLLQVTFGCSHNACTFCNMYRDKPFRVNPLEYVEQDLQDIRRECGFDTSLVDRVFLEDGDALAIGTDHLGHVLQMIRHYFPEVSTVTSHVSIGNLARKSDEELRGLHDLGLDEVYIGVESGWGEVVKAFGKGYDPSITLRELERLNRLGISYSLLIMFGAAGKGKGLENARHTAAMISAVEPSRVMATTLAVFPDTELEQQVAKGEFLPASELEVLQEELALIRAVDSPDTFFSAAHILDSTPVVGYLGIDRERMCATLQKAIDDFDPLLFAQTFKRDTL